MQPKRVLLVECNDDGTVGGSHQALFDLVRSLDRSRFEPSVLFYQSNRFEDRLRTLGIPVHSFESIHQRESQVRRAGNTIRKSFDILAAVHRRYRFLKAFQVDLVHLNNGPVFGFDDWLPAASLARIPCIASAMSAHSGIGFIWDRLIRRFDRVLPVSGYIAEEMRKSGIPVDRIDVVNHGVDLERLRSMVKRDRKDVLRELGVEPGQLLAVMVANIRAWKGQHVVLAALKQLGPEVRRRLRVAFAGAVGNEDEAYAQSLRRSARSDDLERCVTFLGYRSDVPDLFHAADIALHASTTPEPGGIAVLEAMVFGNAVVAANRGGHTEYLVDGAGRTFDVNDPGELAGILTEIVNAPEMKESLSREALSRVEMYTLRKNAERTQAIYASLL